MASDRRQTHNNKKNKGNRVFYIISQAILCAILFFTIGKIGEKTHAYVAERAYNKDIQENLGINFTASSPAPPASTGSPAKTVPPYPVATPQRYSYPEGITLEMLRTLEAKNPDFAFWLYIPGPEINYNVMHAEDNDKYLHRNIDNEYSYSGALFLDFRNDPDTLDGHTIVYGHNMNDGSMFGNLLKYYTGGDDSYLKKYPYMYTYSDSEAGVGIWQIFSVYETTTDEYYIETYFDSTDAYYNFIKDFQNKAVYKTDILLKAEDDVMTLSTCYKFNHENGRLVVNAVRVGTSILPEY